MPRAFLIFLAELFIGEEETGGFRSLLLESLQDQALIRARLK